MDRCLVQIITKEMNVKNVKSQFQIWTGQRAKFKESEIQE
jgi:hypothetical protein